jgi:hypothetical protein
MLREGISVVLIFKLSLAFPVLALHLKFQFSSVWLVLPDTGHDIIDEEGQEGVASDQY